VVYDISDNYSIDIPLNYSLFFGEGFSSIENSSGNINVRFADFPVSREIGNGITVSDLELALHLQLIALESDHIYRYVTSGFSHTGPMTL
jgi:hypothetical protein